MIPSSPMPTPGPGDRNGRRHAVPGMLGAARRVQASRSDGAEHTGDVKRRMCCESHMTGSGVTHLGDESLDANPVGVLYLVQKLFYRCLGVTRTPHPKAAFGRP